MIPPSFKPYAIALNYPQKENFLIKYYSYLELNYQANIKLTNISPSVFPKFLLKNGWVYGGVVECFELTI